MGVPHRLEKGMSGSEDAGPEGGWIVRSHIGWGGERNIFYKCVETSPRVLKTLRVSLKGKAQRGQCLLAVGLGRYSTFILLKIFFKLSLLVSDRSKKHC